MGECVDESIQNIYYMFVAMGERAREKEREREGERERGRGREGERGG